jgi:hypothetical protein
MRFLFAGLILLAVGCGIPKPDVSALELFFAHQDRPKADHLYRDRTISVGGTVKWVGYSWVTTAGSNTVHLSNDEKTTVLVVCNFPAESSLSASGLREGEQVVIQGLCRGAVWGDGVPILYSCELVR